MMTNKVKLSLIDILQKNSTSERYQTKVTVGLLSVGHMGLPGFSGQIFTFLIT